MFVIALVFFLVIFAHILCENASPPVEVKPDPVKDWRLEEAYPIWWEKLASLPGPYPTGYKDGVLTLSNGLTLEGAFATEPYVTCDNDILGRYRIVGWRKKDGEIILTTEKKIPMASHIRTFVGALSQPNISSLIEELIYSLAEQGKVTADVTKINGISTKRYMSEFFDPDMKNAWGEALLEVLDGAADKYELDKNKPWLVTLHAPKEPISLVS